MEFRIGIHDETPEQPNQPTSAQQPAPQQAPQSATQQPSVPIPQLQAIQQTLLPAIAAASPQIARKLYAEATESSVAMPLLEAKEETREPAAREVAAREVLSEQEIAQVKRQFGAMAEQILAAATTRLPVEKTPEPRGSVIPTPLPSIAEPTSAPIPQAESAPFTLPPLESLTIVHEAKQAEPQRQLGEDIGKAAGKAFVDEILPPLEELTLIGREEGEILPPLEELRPVAELPGAAAERERRAKREKAMADYAREGVVDLEAIPEAIDVAEEAAKARLRATRQRVREDAAYARITGNEEPVYDVIDPNAKARQEHLAQMNEYLQGGSRIAAQAGLGATGQIIGGVADVAVGAATADPFQIIAGALQVASGAAHGVAEAFDTVTEVVRGYTDYVGDAIQNNYIGAFENRLDAVGHILEKIPIAGEAVAAGFDMIVQPLRSFFEITEDFLTRGGKLGELSPDLAVANAMAEVRSTLADIQEANELGPELARMTDNFSQLMTELRELFLPFKEFLTSVMADLWGTLLDYLRDARAVLNKEFLSTFAENLGLIIAGAMTFQQEAVTEGVRSIKLELERQRRMMEADRDKDMWRFSEQFYRNLVGLNPGAGEPVFNPAERGAGRQPGLRPDLFPASGF